MLQQDGPEMESRGPSKWGVLLPGMEFISPLLPQVLYFTLDKN